MRFTPILIAALLGTTTPAGAQQNSFCRGDARSLERELILRGGQMSALDRVLMERRLTEAGGLCDDDPGRGRSELEQLRRDLILQAQRPGSIPPEGGLPWSRNGPGMHSWD